jgi:uncharacterized phage protein (TIGR01671 family)
MRELKFRAFVGTDRPMEYFDIMHVPASWLETNGLWDYGGIRYILMQYTGLKDNKGIEIYAGDIVQYLGNKILRYEISFEDFAFRARGFKPMKDEQLEKRVLIETPLDGQSENYEVIGNIHQNPELVYKNV